jgi:hypothetical protein
MTCRSKHLPIYTFLVGMMLFSIGTNIIFYNRITLLQDFIMGSNPWMTVDQFDHIQKEIQRLENEKYQIVPKQ